jgi:hypothetical protein
MLSTSGNETCTIHFRELRAMQQYLVTAFLTLNAVHLFDKPSVNSTTSWSWFQPRLLLL